MTVVLQERDEISGLGGVVFITLQTTNPVAPRSGKDLLVTFENYQSGCDGTSGQNKSCLKA